MTNSEKVIKKAERIMCSTVDRDMIDSFCEDVIALLKELDARIQKYEYVFDFLGIGFRQWATKILDGEAEAICETDEHEHKTVVTFKLI